MAASMYLIALLQAGPAEQEEGVEVGRQGLGEQCLWWWWRWGGMRELPPVQRTATRTPPTLQTSWSLGRSCSASNSVKLCLAPETLLGPATSALVTVSSYACLAN